MKKYKGESNEHEALRMNTKLHTIKKARHGALEKKKGLDRFKDFKLQPCKECGKTSVHTHQ